MELFQIFGSVLLLGVAGGFVYTIFKNMYLETIIDSRGVTHKRNIRNGRFVRVK
jgi:hypothetical protein